MTRQDEGRRDGPRRRQRGTRARDALSSATLAVGICLGLGALAPLLAPGTWVVRCILAVLLVAAVTIALRAVVHGRW